MVGNPRLRRARGPMILWCHVCPRAGRRGREEQASPPSPRAAMTAGAGRRRETRPPRACRVRCSTASVPTSTRCRGTAGSAWRSGGDAPVTSATSVPNRAASSSRSLLTPTRRVFMRKRPQAAHTTGRVRFAAGAPQHFFSPRSRRRPRHIVRTVRAHRRPGRPADGRHRCGCTRKRRDPRPPPCRRAPCGRVARTRLRTARCGDRRGRRSTVSSAAQPARSACARAAIVPGPFGAASATGGMGDTRMHGAPSRRARSTSTSTAL